MQSFAPDFAVGAMVFGFCDLDAFFIPELQPLYLYDLTVV
jgi:hypothetical protein